MSTQVPYTVAALLWLQGQSKPVSTSDVEMVIGIGQRAALRLLRALEATGAVRCLGERRSAPGRRGHQGLLWSAVDIDDALDAALARCRGDA